MPWSKLSVRCQTPWRLIYGFLRSAVMVPASKTNFRIRQRYASMIFYSTNKSSVPASLKKATLEGLAPDGGLYVPSEIPAFSPGEPELLQNAPFTDIAFAIAKKFTGDEIPHDRLYAIIEECYTFDTPCTSLTERHLSRNCSTDLHLRSRTTAPGSWRE